MISEVTRTTVSERQFPLNPRGIADYVIGTLVVFVTAVCLYTPQILLFKQLAANTLYIMLAAFAIGILFFLLRFEKLMVVSLICCCVLCLHLKSSANKQMRLANVSAFPSITVSHINLANAENDYDSVVNYLLSIDADFISFQELTPDWNAQLRNRLSSKFEYIHTMTRLDQYGMGFFSNVPFYDLDTLYFNDIPALVCSVEMGNDRVCHLMSCQGIPPVSQSAFAKIENHFSYLADYLENKEGGVIVLGELHLPPWSSEIHKFKSMTRLQDSRRDINPRNLDGSVSFPRIPVEHIFYCDKFECTSFSELGNNSVGRVGITGTYQLHRDYAEVTQ